MFWGRLLAHGWLIVELVVLFGGVPLAFLFSPRQVAALPVLWVVSVYAGWVLWHDTSFDRTRLWHTDAVPGQLVWILPVFAVIALLQWIAVRCHAPELEWSMVREKPRIWALVLVLYPVLSVYPQGLVFRAFFLHRYAVLFPGTWMLIVASAAAFGFMHIIFRNPLAVGLTFVGGLLFAWRYEVTGSLMASNVEHALYGCWLFTVGLGQYFYHGVWPRYHDEVEAA
jgi:membrane protease YdiL (CAAX protease family)